MGGNSPGSEGGCPPETEAQLVVEEWSQEVHVFGVGYGGLVILSSSLPDRAALISACRCRGSWQESMNCCWRRG